MWRFAAASGSVWWNNDWFLQISEASTRFPFSQSQKIKRQINNSLGGIVFIKSVMFRVQTAPFDKITIDFCRSRRRLHDSDLILTKNPNIWPKIPKIPQKSPKIPKNLWIPRIPRWRPMWRPIFSSLFGLSCAVLLIYWPRWSWQERPLWISCIFACCWTIVLHHLHCWARSPCLLPQVSNWIIGIHLSNLLIQLGLHIGLHLGIPRNPWIFGYFWRFFKYFLDFWSNIKVFCENNLIFELLHQKPHRII